MFAKFFNRPISPHITIYLPQVSSLSSIWHRLTAIIIVSYVLIFMYALKLYFWIVVTTELNYFLQVIYTIWNSRLTNFFISLVVFYHTINGLRHIKWSLGYTLESKKTNNSIITFASFLFLLQFLNIS